MTETRVGHTRSDDCDHYVGRGPGGADMTDVAPPSRGWLGNPFTLEDHAREAAVKRFREVFERRLETDPAFRERVRELAGSTLGCWCQRLDDDGPACHAEVIAEHADRLADGGEAGD